MNVDELSDTASEAGVSAMPTFHFYKGGKKIDELVGADPRKLQWLVQKHSVGSEIKAGGGGGSSGAFSGEGRRLGDPAPSEREVIDVDAEIEELSEMDQIYLISLIEYGFSREQGIKGIPSSYMLWVVVVVVVVPPLTNSCSPSY